MKKFYILFFAIPLLILALLYFSIWWFVGGIGILMVFLAYQFYATRLRGATDRIQVMEKELEEVNIHLEHSVLKEQKAMKDANQMRLMKKQLLSVLSHEIRTPMNGIMGMALLLEDTPLTEQQKEYVTTIRNSGESLLTTVNNILVNDVLDFSKVQQDGQLEYKDFNLRDSIEEVLDLFADKISKKGIDLLYYMDDNAPEQIIGDTKRLRQIVMNLIENAVKFTHKGEVYVGLHYTAHSAQGHPPVLKFEVRDTGIGIPKEQLKQLFKGIPGKDYKQTGEDNTGIGLVVCKKLIELMGGTIEVQSEPGIGSTFSFTIPVTPSLKPLRSHAREKEMINLEEKSILVVDDNNTSLSILTNLLKAWKMLPVAAHSAKQALDLLAGDKEFQAILTDIDMPEMDGVQFVKTVKSQYPAIKIIGMNKAGDEKHRQEPDAFSFIINKPIRKDILRDHLLNVFSQQNLDKPNDSAQMSDVFGESYPLRILIAEDNLVNQKIAVKILTSLGYKPALANNGKEALEMVSNETYDVILMDVQMPEMDGLEATRMIRTCLEVQPVIIAMTANVMQGDRDACMQAGMDDYMSKPIVLKELLSQLEKWAKALKEKRKTNG